MNEASEFRDLLPALPEIVLAVGAMAEHGSLARRVGVGKVVLCRNGDLIRLAPGDPAIIDEVPAGRLYKDGCLLVDAQARTVADRRRLGFVGIVSVALAMDVKETTAVVVMALTLSLLATLYPSWRAARLDPVEALRYE